MSQQKVFASLHPPIPQARREEKLQVPLTPNNPTPSAGASDGACVVRMIETAEDDLRRAYNFAKCDNEVLLAINVPGSAWKDITP